MLALVRRRAPGRRLGGRRLSAAAPRGVRGGRAVREKSAARSGGKVPGHRGRSRQNMAKTWEMIRKTMGNPCFLLENLGHFEEILENSGKNDGTIVGNAEIPRFWKMIFSLKIAD